LIFVRNDLGKLDILIMQEVNTCGPFLDQYKVILFKLLLAPDCMKQGVK